jgi:hypothetical protein
LNLPRYPLFSPKLRPLPCDQYYMSARAALTEVMSDECLSAFVELPPMGEVLYNGVHSVFDLSLGTVMQNLKIRSFSLAVCAFAALAVGAPALAQHGGGGGGGGGGHSSGGAAVAHGGSYGGGYGGYHGGAYYGGYRGGYYGGYHGYYGGYYGGYRGYYGGYYGPWGWGYGGIGLGLYFATLPYYYSTYYYGGVPYYYADNVYYRYDDAAGQYQTVSPPEGAPTQPAGQGGPPPAAPDLIAYPKNGQTPEQQGKDKFECYQWAVSQTGFDPTKAGGGAAPNNRSDYYRAQAACLEGRGYSVK